ncbi:MAG: rubrerythrin family protein [Parcubacteria group bacterium]
MKTAENLQAAFAGESQANRKYLAFAKKAETDGQKGLAQLFRVAAEGETIHALGHLAVLGGVGDSKANLQAAIDGETHEFTEMYPRFIEEAQSEGEGAAVLSFQRANEIEKEHAKLFQEALAQEGDIAEQTYYVCGVCGHVEIGAKPEKCPVCGAPKDKFKEIV